VERPHIFDYHDYRQFLDDFFKYKKATREAAGRATYTHEMFALEAGVKSRSTLVRIISGDRHLTDALQRAFAQALGLAPNEEAFLGLLSARERAAQEVTHLSTLAEEAGAAARAPGATRREQRGYDAARKGLTEARDALREIDDRINGMRRMSRATKLDATTSIAINTWSAIALVELARCGRGLTWDTERLVRLLDNRVTTEEVERTLRLLLALDLLEELPDGRLIPRQATMDGGPQSPPDQVAAIYLSVYDRLGEAMRRSFVDQDYARMCRLGTATFAIPSSAIPVVRQELLRLRTQLFGYFEGLTGEPDVVYQVWLHAFPVTEVVGREDG